jgi:hypothetical protein
MMTTWTKRGLCWLEKCFYLRNRVVSVGGRWVGLRVRFCDRQFAVDGLGSEF